MFKIKTIKPGDDSPAIVAEHTTSAMLATKWQSCRKKPDVITLFCFGDDVLAFHIPTALRTPEITAVFKVF